MRYFRVLANGNINLEGIKKNSAFALTKKPNMEKGDILLVQVVGKGIDPHEKEVKYVMEVESVEVNKGKVQSIWPNYPGEYFIQCSGFREIKTPFKFTDQNLSLKYTSSYPKTAIRNKDVNSIVGYI